MTRRVPPPELHTTATAYPAPHGRRSTPPQFGTLVQGSDPPGPDFGTEGQVAARRRAARFESDRRTCGIGPRRQRRRGRPARRNLPCCTAAELTPTCRVAATRLRAHAHMGVSSLDLAARRKAERPFFVRDGHPARILARRMARVATGHRPSASDAGMAGQGSCGGPPRCRSGPASPSPSVSAPAAPRWRTFHSGQQCRLSNRGSRRTVRTAEARARPRSVPRPGDDRPWRSRHRSDAYDRTGTGRRRWPPRPGLPGSAVGGLASSLAIGLAAARCGARVPARVALEQIA